MRKINHEELTADADLMARIGASGLEIGYTGGDLSEEKWFAFVRYSGARIMVDNQAGPMEAMEALAIRVLTGARCSCGKLVTLDGIGAVAFTQPRMADGTVFPIAEAIAGGQCHWKRTGRRWSSECGR
ncbi:MAG TPA: hypothetical protein VGH54_28095 [Mycobacterium sp.]|jgi:hypothetical protein|uniref:hypothetical protein n=1 Tax=Mycobacterium sp. TaxID=1785 RepID=UPI002F3E5618